MKKNIYFPLVIIFLFLLFSCKREEKAEQKKEEPVDLTKFEAYCKDYFVKDTTYRDFSKTITQRTREFMAINEGTKEFAGKTPFKIFPVYSYGVEGVAYYEVWLTRDGKKPEGWLLFSATDKDYPLVNFSHEGIPYSFKVAQRAKDKGITVDSNYKTYRFGVSYYSLEDRDGKKVSDFGEMPGFVPKDIDLSSEGKGDSETAGEAEGEMADTVKLIDGVHYNSINSYDDLKKYFEESYFTPKRSENAREMVQRIFPEDKHGEAYNYIKGIGAGEYTYRWIGGTQCLYTQIPANTSFNYTGCWSGCNNNAWAGLYGWWDLSQGKTNLIPSTSTGEGCPTTRSSQQRRDVIDPVQMWFRGTCETYCSGGGGWTQWKKAWYGYKYTSSRGYGYSYWYQWCNSSGCNVNLANILVDCIGNNNKPAHIGANSHFYVGTGFAQWTTNTDWTYVYCYPGWSTDHSDDVWIYWRDLNSVTRVYVY